MLSHFRRTIGGLASLVLLSGCGDPLKDENAQLLQENEQLRTDLTDAVAQRDSAELRARDAETRVAQAAVIPAPTDRANTGGAGNTYTVRAGDTLSHIALRFYKDAELWPVIHDANRHLIGDNPARMKVGTKLTIPPR